MRIFAALFVLVVLYFLLGGGGGGDNDLDGEGAALDAVAAAPAAEAPAAKARRRRKKAADGDEKGDDDDDDDDSIKLSDADVIESKFGSLGWTKSQGPLVTKRPPRECAVKRIAPQVTTPFFTVNKKTKWRRRIFTCLRVQKQECAPALLSDLRARRWKVKATTRPLGDRVLSTFVLTDSLTLGKLRVSKPDIFNELYVRNEGSTYLNALLGADGLDGSLLEQFDARASFAKQFGCSYNALKIQPLQFRYDVAGECGKMERAFGKRSAESWLLSSFDEEGVPTGTDTKPTNLLSKGSFCADNAVATSVADSRQLASLIIRTPLRFQSKLFDVRGFVLIGSTMPYMVFFRQGYVRTVSSGNAYSSPFMFDQGSTDVNLEDFQEHMAKEKITGSHYVDTFLKSSMKQVALFVFHAARRNIHRRRGSFQLFAVDYIVDKSFRVYLEKTTGMPKFDGAWDEANMIADMHDLVQELNEVPVAFEGMVKGDKYGGWELIFSELSETCHKILYNPCHAFIDYNDKDLTKQNKKVGRVQATAKRLENEQKRIVKKTEERKKQICRENKVPYPGTKCNKLVETIDQEEFNKLFKEHEQSFNPNDFRLPKPGEVFPHEIVTSSGGIQPPGGEAADKR